MLDIYLSWTFDLNSLQIWTSFSANLLMCVASSTPPPHWSQPHPQLLTKVTSIKTAFYKRSLEILRISEIADECFNWTIVCSPNHFYFLIRRSGASRTTKKETSIPLELPASCLERGWGVVVDVVVVGFGSSLQQVLASVELPLGGQQKLP